MIDVYIRSVDQEQGKWLCASMSDGLDSIVQSVKKYGANLGSGDDEVYFDSRFCEKYSDGRYTIFEIIVESANSN